MFFNLKNKTLINARSDYKVNKLRVSQESRDRPTKGVENHVVTDLAYPARNSSKGKLATSSDRARLRQTDRMIL